MAQTKKILRALAASLVLFGQGNAASPVITSKNQFPSSCGTSGYLLQSNGNCTSTWVSSGGFSTSPGGSNTQVQFNNSGSFGGNSGFVYSSGNVGIGTTTPGQKLQVAGTVESTSGGFKFPDGTTQTSAASAFSYSAPVQETPTYLNSPGGIATASISTTTWSRLGKWMVVQFTLQAGTPAISGGGNFGLQVPNSKSIDTSLLPITGAGAYPNSIGTCTIVLGATIVPTFAYAVSSTEIGVYNDFTGSQLIYSTLGTAGRSVACTVQIPIQGW